MESLKVWLYQEIHELQKLKDIPPTAGTGGLESYLSHQGGTTMIVRPVDTRTWLMTHQISGNGGRV